MNYKWIGAAFILCGCSCFGFDVIGKHRQKVRLHSELLWLLQYMERELQYRMVLLPELCRNCGKETSGVLRELFLNLAGELERNTAPDVSCCMSEAIRKSHPIFPEIKSLLMRLGGILGRFDLPGQIKGLETIRVECEENLQALKKDQELRFRNLRTLGICAGIALVILFL